MQPDAEAEIATGAQRTKHKPGQRRAFLEYLRDPCGLEEDVAWVTFLSWAADQKYDEKYFRALENLSKQHDHTNFLQDDHALYDFCKYLGKEAPAHAFAGAVAVGDPLEDFANARANRRHVPHLVRHRGTYHVVRPGSQEVRLGKKPVSNTQIHELKIDHRGDHSPHARFTYRDLGTPDKPEPNRVKWRGRVVASQDVLYLVGVADHYSDVVMLILWEHPDEEHLLVGVQLAKLSAHPDDADQRNYTIARRLAAIKQVQGADRASLRGKADNWIASEPMGAFIPIDPPESDVTRD